VDAVALQPGRGLNTFPGGCDLDQHAVHVHALTLVEVDDAARPRHGRFGVEAQAGIDLGGHAAGNELQDLAAETHQQAICHLVQTLRTVLRHSICQQVRVLGLLHRFQDERGIGRGILRRKRGDLFEVAGVGHHGGELFECVELIHGTHYRTRQVIKFHLPP